MTIKDKRYTVNHEFIGADKKHFVARFCGEYIGADTEKMRAELLCITHAEKRGHNHTGWRVVAENSGVLWIYKHTGKKKHRVIYGAEISDFTPAQEIDAAENFGHCVLHAATCESLID